MNEKLSQEFSKKLKRDVSAIVLPSPLVFASLVMTKGQHMSRDRDRYGYEPHDLTTPVRNTFRTAYPNAHKGLQEHFTLHFPGLSKALLNKFHTVLLNELSSSGKKSFRWFRYTAATRDFNVMDVVNQIAVNPCMYEPLFGSVRSELRLISKAVGTLVGGTIIDPSVTLAEDLRPFDAWAMLYWANSNYIFVIESPTTQTRNDKGQLHDIEKPALVFKDGFSVSCINGSPIVCPSGDIRNLSSADLMKHSEEAQRAIVSAVGVQGILLQTGYTVIHFQGDYELITVPHLGRFLRMRNPSTAEWHFESVPSDVKTCDEALAFRNHQEGKNFVPPVQLT